MTKLQEEILECCTPWVNGADRYNQNLHSHLDYASNEIAKEAAEIAKKYITKALNDLFEKNTERMDQDDLIEFRKNWFKTNGVE